MGGRKSCNSQRHTFQNKLWAEFRFHMQHLENVCFRWCPLSDWFAQLISSLWIQTTMWLVHLKSDWRAEWFWYANGAQPQTLRMLIWGMFTFLSTYCCNHFRGWGAWQGHSRQGYWLILVKDQAPYLLIKHGSLHCSVEEGVSDSILGVVIKERMREAVSFSSRCTLELDSGAN